jgi:hypothetical protein
VAGTGFDAAQARLVRLAGGRIRPGVRGTGSGAGPGGAGAGGVAAGGGMFRDPVTRGQSAVLTLQWAAAGPGGGLFPVLDADIAMAPYGESGRLIALAGHTGRRWG